MSLQNAEKKGEKRELVVLQGGALVRHIMKKGGKGGLPLSLEDLNEEVLQKRLKKLNLELELYKPKCSKLKTENDW
jgi:hypothetical protein